MNNAIRLLQELLDEWLLSGKLPEVDWKSRTRVLQLQELLRARDGLLQQISTYVCRQCPDFHDHVSFAPCVLKL